MASRAAHGPSAKVNAGDGDAASSAAASSAAASSAAVRPSRPLQLPFDPIGRAAEIWERRFGPSAEMAAVTSVMRAQQILIAELDAVLKPYKLTFARYEALVLLSFSRTGALPLRVIGERLMVHPTSVTNIIARLERQGMVARRPNPRDGRGRLAEITGDGRSVVERATADLTAARFGMAGYDGGQLREMFTLLKQLRIAAGDFEAPGKAPAAALGADRERGRAPGGTRSRTGASSARRRR